MLQRLPAAYEGFVADVGAGTGAVGLALASARPGLKLYATDISQPALGNTRANVAALGLEQRVAVLEGPLLQPIPPHRPIDVVVSNPPYIPGADIAALDDEVGVHEPRLALDGGPDGLDVYRALIPEAARRCRLGVAVEIGHDQGAAVSALFTGAGLLDVRVLQDLGGRDRVVLGRRADARWPVEPPALTPPAGDAVVVPDTPADESAAEGDAVLVLDPSMEPDALDENGDPLPVIIRD